MIICVIYKQSNTSTEIKQLFQQQPVFSNETFERNELTGISPVTKCLGFCLSVSGGQISEQQHFRGTTVDMGFSVCMCV